ncbi:MAG: hypothetical protein HY245_11880 [Rhizobiales bacterium]|nr:hypothetical protein [Hyphomicrobiales bacterium]MBI3674087.1 hypothetical protein [Hyphomicrobiales bacterium]
MRFNLAMDDLKGELNRAVEDVEQAVTGAMNEVSDGLKTELREQVTSSGLGQRLANTWRGKRFPEARPSMNSAAYVWSKAPDIIDAYERGPTIVPVNGRKYLAIPTANCPPRRRGGGFGGKGRKASPFEVETIFNQDLKFAKAANGRLIAFIEAVGARSKRGFRPGTPKRLAQGRAVVAVVMFILVPAVQVRKRLDVEGAANRWADRVPRLIAQHWR